MKRISTIIIVLILTMFSCLACGNGIEFVNAAGGITYVEVDEYRNYTFYVYDPDFSERAVIEVVTGELFTFDIPDWWTDEMLDACVENCLIFFSKTT